MITAVPDKGRNLLRVTYSGRVGLAEARVAAAALQAGLSELQSGVRLLTDLTALEQMDSECEPVIKRMMDLCNQKGVCLLVRVIPDPHKDIGFNIMSLFHYRHDLRIVTCDTVAEAEELLAREG